MSTQFPYDFFDACGQRIYKVELSNLVITAETAKDLADLFSRLHTSASCDITIWIAIVSKHLPEYFVQALAYFGGFGFGIVVTHGDKCSHAPGERLPEPVVDALRAVNRTDVKVWHPFANKLVAAQPQENKSGKQG